MLEKEEEAGEAYMLVSHHFASSFSYGDIVVNENKEEVEQCSTDVEEVV